MTPTFTEALSWLTEFMAEKHPDINHLPTKSAEYWSNDFIEYCLYEGAFGEPRFSLTNVEITEYDIFMFVVPETKEDLFTVLNILDKP